MSRFRNHSNILLAVAEAFISIALLTTQPLARSENSGSQTDPSDQLAALYAQAGEAYQQQDTAKFNQLLTKIFAVADANHLGADPSFSQTLKLLYVVSDPNKKLDFLESALRIAARDDPETAKNLCGQIIGQSVQGLMTNAPGAISLDELDRRYPACKETLDPIRQRLTPIVAMKQGDYGAFTATLKQKFDEAQASGMQDDTVNAAGMVFFSLMSNDISGARKYVLLLEDDLQHLEADKPVSLPGLPELAQFENSGSGSGYRDSSLAAFYHLRFTPNDAVMRMNAMQLILSAKNRELDDAQVTIQALRNSSSDESQLAAEMISEYSNSAGIWARANFDRTPLTQADEQNAIKRMEALQEGMSKIYNSDSASHQGQRAPRVAEVAQKLGQDDVLIEFEEIWWPDYHAGSHPPIDIRSMGTQVHYVAYVLKHDASIFAVDLGDASSINSQITKFRGSMRPSITDWSEASRQLYALLWKPLLPALPPPDSKTAHVFVSPDSDVALLPFDGLMNDANKYLVQLWDISYLTSGRQLAKWSKKPSGTNPVRATTNSTIVFANPDFNPTEAQSRAGRARVYPRLPQTQQEADAIKLTLPDVKVYSGIAASKSALESTTSPMILHLATHGYYLDPPKNSSSDISFDRLTKKEKYGFLRSGLILSGGNSPDAGEQDRVMTSLEIAMLNLSKTQLVVLSACDSGVGDTTLGDNVSGLRSAFQMAGTKALISSLWTINDKMGEALMESFYRNLAGDGKSGKTSINQSLRQAKLSMLATEPHPYYWAPFVFEGEDQILIFSSPH